MHRFLCSLLWVLGVPLMVWAQQPEMASLDAIMPLAEVRPGQQGYGLSVFQGHDQQRFDVEVLGVWNQVAPDTSFILARLSGMGLEESGVIAGMSGSPVYLDGRLAGAVAFAWPFAIHPIAGITPIEAMRRLRMEDSASADPVSPGGSVSLSQLVSGEFPTDLLAGSLARWRTAPMAGASSGIGWIGSGFGTRTEVLLSEQLGVLSPAGQSTPAVAEDLSAGDSVAAVLMTGDIQLAATGTVTERTGDEILAFGHPFLSIGPLQVPMATSEVITVLANLANSFKITNLGQIVGAFDLDRKSGIRGRLGRQASMTPLVIEVVGDRQRSFSMQLARVPMMTPSLVAIALLGALDAVTQAGGSQSLDLHTEFELGARGVLPVVQSFDGDSAAVDAALYLFAFADYLLNNHLAEIELAEIRIELQQHSQPRLATLVGAHASRTRVRPGDRVSLSVDLVEYRSRRRRISMDVVIPTSIPDGRYSLLVGDGVSIDVARLTVEQTEPVSFDQALDLLRSLHSRRELVVLGLFSGPGLAVAGEVLPQLPGSVQSLWGAASSSSAVPLRLAIADQQEMDLEIPLVGAVRIDLDVRRDGPVGPREGVEGQILDSSSPSGEAAVEGSGASTGSDVPSKEGSV
jgi:hypothetical protein